LIWGILAGAVMSAGAYRFGLLTRSGALAAFALSVPIFGFGGWMWAVPLLVFFGLSNALSKVGKRRKRQYSLVFEKGNRRDAFQVLANGGVAGVIAVLHMVTGDVHLYAFYCASLAAAAADTWATEIGTLARGTPRLITSLRPVPAGTSGGITLMGLLGASGGALSVALSGWAFYGDWGTVAWMTACGVTGCLIDSLLGATVQAQYRCGECGKVTEQVTHCDQPTARISGWAWVNNDWVNVLSIASVVGIAIMMR